jgi:hypothetical protein
MLIAWFESRFIDLSLRNWDMNIPTLIQLMTHSYVLARSRSPPMPKMRGACVGHSFVLLKQIRVSVRVVKELIGRFDHYIKTGDDSKIPADLQVAIFSTVRLTACRFPASIH